MKPELTISALIEEARAFCALMGKVNHSQLLGVTDGKAVGTYIEGRFQNYIAEKYTVAIGSSAKGDLELRT